MGLLAWLFERMGPDPRPATPGPHGFCLACCYFEDDSEDLHAPDVGYCCHPWHSTKASAHHEYGGHWTGKHNTCPMWKSR